MPMITVDLFEGRTREQREAFAKGVTELAVRILKTTEGHTWILFRDHGKSHWAMGGKLCDQ
ncbi:MAG: 4-oxalocrotonate tautomerase family protein [Candidatus Omnitrophica bacterium]|nr:4-oxalocrotonate tautomerase family protein [Candidatus Omnitrophota bacterium]